MRWFGLLGAVALVGCKADLECVAHVECGAEQRCVEGSCQAGDGPEPEVDMAEPEAPEPAPQPEGQPDPQPDPGPDPVDMADLGPPVDLGPGPEPDMGPEPGPDRALFQRTILGILSSNCASCHASNTTPGDGDFNVDSGMFNAMYDEVQEFLNLRLPDQSRLLVMPTGAGHDVIWARDSPDYTQVLNWIRTGQQ